MYRWSEFLQAFLLKCYAACLDCQSRATLVQPCGSPCTAKVKPGAWRESCCGNYKDAWVLEDCLHAAPRIVTGSAAQAFLEKYPQFKEQTRLGGSPGCPFAWGTALSQVKATFPAMAGPWQSGVRTMM